MYSLDALDEESDYIIFDDCDPEHLRNQYKSWIGAQNEFNATDKYRAKRTVKWGKPCIWLSNTDPRDCEKWDRNWVDGNAVVINLNHRLWEPEPAPPAPPMLGLQGGHLAGILNDDTLYYEDLYN
jgi:hypothetical protein